MMLQNVYMMAKKTSTPKTWPSRSSSEWSAVSTSLLASEDSSGSWYARKAP